MTAAMFVTYVWHYVVARLIYDQIVRPMLHGHVVGVAIAVVCMALAVSLLRRRRRR
jgi:uncharacterized protein (TIGR03382 family)